MNAACAFALLDNGSGLPWAQVPESTPEDLVEGAVQLLQRGGRLCAWFGVPEGAGTRLVAVVAFDAEHRMAVGRSTPAQHSYPALTPHHAPAHLFEREVWEQHGLVPQGHLWLKPVRRDHGAGPAVGDFFQVEGDEIHEVAVGPIHAGVIEPGHFRFQCDGEQVLHLEIALGYQHRGIEEALVNGPHRPTVSQMETVAGDTTIGHATAYALVMEALGGIEASPRAQWLRSLALELERLANHVGDLGALANDVAFLPASAACGKIRGDFLNLTALLCGNRFGRGLVRPGGCRHDLEPARVEQLHERLRSALADAEEAAAWLWEASSVRARFEGVGALSMLEAEQLGLVGPAARACGLARDVRQDHPAGWHRRAPVPVAVGRGGSVLARARVRWMEVQHSGRFLDEQLAAPPEGPVRRPDGASAGADDRPVGGRAAADGWPPAEQWPAAGEQLAVALVEGWRGEICHVALTDAAGRFRRYKIVDPSFHNWTGLAMALRGQAISDFPVCNKSFNLSYCGFDL